LIEFAFREKETGMALLLKILFKVLKSFTSFCAEAKKEPEQNILSPQESP
jgi:hypothetical protein